MSRVIKNSDMLLSPPIIIDSLEYAETPGTGGDEIILPDNSDSQLLDPEKQNLDKVKQESQDILKETEQMVLDLLQKARDEARDIISNARAEAEVVRLQASEEIVQSRQKAEKEAYAEGLKRAHEEIEADRQLAMQQGQAILEEARQSKLKVFRSSETDMVRLVMAITKKVIATELKTNPAIIISVLQEAIDYLDKPENIMVYVNPQDIDTVLEVKDSGNLTDIGSNNTKLDIKSDERVSMGGCLLESDAGSVDAQLETRIASVENAIQEVVADEY